MRNRARRASALNVQDKGTTPSRPVIAWRRGGANLHHGSSGRSPKTRLSGEKPPGVSPKADGLPFPHRPHSHYRKPMQRQEAYFLQLSIVGVASRDCVPLHASSLVQTLFERICDRKWILNNGLYVFSPIQINVSSTEQEPRLCVILTKLGTLRTSVERRSKSTSVFCPVRPLIQGPVVSENSLRVASLLDPSATSTPRASAYPARGTRPRSAGYRARGTAPSPPGPVTFLRLFSSVFRSLSPNTSVASPLRYHSLEWPWTLPPRRDTSLSASVTLPPMYTVVLDHFKVNFQKVLFEIE
ncbi:hypothetical protein J6590_015997 [Homalodisca vitripennis]|nr:hypothetical protein J6590_096219 [Homalodisca vitripennis]KAG8312813.1 hypothetical protein J6590_015997 [Homalodisca vitripennis]